MNVCENYSLMMIPHDNQLYEKVNQEKWILIIIKYK